MTVTERPEAATKLRLRLLTATVVITLAALSVGYAWLEHEFLAPRRHAQSVHALLETLVDRRPEEMTRGQWGSAVAWTLNLHGNSMLMFEAEADAIADFERRLREKLDGRVDRATIDWIWNEYAGLCPHGANYQRFKPMMLDEIAQVGPDDDPWGMNVP